jgi:uncharacterized Zn-binding protein involved in type VI secretion|tara:strand:- start:161 stop:460 length:300 start_codon:yes stop_codon:yes gene_type:complete
MGGNLMALFAATVDTNVIGKEGIGKIFTGELSVLIEGKPASRLSSMVSPYPPEKVISEIITGSQSVLVGGLNMTRGTDINNLLDKVDNTTCATSVVVGP